MKWLGRRKPELGDKIEYEKFLFFPIKIAGEWRWFERARWLEEYVRTSSILIIFEDCPDPYWKRVKWLTPQKPS